MRKPRATPWDRRKGRKRPTIAQLNDTFRQSFGVGPAVPGTVVLTRGVASLADEIKAGIITSVKTFDRFNADNDPHGEHDFGMIEHAIAGKIFWKIDYYDREMEHASSDPRDTRITQRVLTVMLAEEY